MAHDDIIDYAERVRALAYAHVDMGLLWNNIVDMCLSDAQTVERHGFRSSFMEETLDNMYERLAARLVDSQNEMEALFPDGERSSGYEDLLAARVRACEEHLGACELDVMEALRQHGRASMEFLHSLNERDETRRLLGAAMEQAEAHGLLGRVHLAMQHFPPLDMPPELLGQMVHHIDPQRFRASQRYRIIPRIRGTTERV